MAKKKFKVKTRYIFEGIYTVTAEDSEEADRLVVRQCGLVLGGNIHTTLNDEEIDWDFDLHPGIEIQSVICIEK